MVLVMTIMVDYGVFSSHFKKMMRHNYDTSTIHF